eukprot:scaffold15483_cov221-Alexandrium_tamarense.AAC.2
MMMSSVLTSTVLRHQRHHLVKPLSLSPLLLPSITTTPPPPSSSSNYSTSTTLHARPGSTNNHADRNPKIKITLEQLRMAARGSGRRAPICHEAQERVMNSLEAAKYEIHQGGKSFICLHWFHPVNLVYLLDYPLVAKTYLREYLPINQSHPDSTTNAERNTIENTKAKIGQ